VPDVEVTGIAKVTFTSPDRVRVVINNFNDWSSCRRGDLSTYDTRDGLRPSRVSCGPGDSGPTGACSIRLGQRSINVGFTSEGL
jgi:hypothetical protein